MAYLTLPDLVTRFGNPQLVLLADRDNDGEPDAAVVDRAIADASAIVDLFVRGRYALPLFPIDPAIAVIVGDIARRNLYGDATEVPQSVLDADKAARRQLELIAKGDAQLTCAPASASEPAGALEVESAGDAPFFTSDSLKGF